MINIIPTTQQRHNCEHVSRLESIVTNMTINKYRGICVGLHVGWSSRAYGSL